MATGILGTQVELGATTNTTLYTVPSNTFSIATVSLCNKSTAAVNVRLALASTSSPSAAEWIEYDTVIPAKAVLERTGIALQAGKLVVAYSSAASAISASVFGIETPTV